MNLHDLPYFNALTLAIRRALYGDWHPVVDAMRRRNAMKDHAA